MGSAIVTEGTLALYTSARKIVLLALAGIAIEALGIWFLSVAHGALDAIIAGGLLVPSGLAVAAATVVALVKRRRPLILFEPETLTFYNGGVFELPWRDLESAHIAGIRRTKFVVLVPYDVESYIAAAVGGRRFQMRSNCALVGGALALPTLTDYKAEELLTLVLAHAAAARA